MSKIKKTIVLTLVLNLFAGFSTQAETGVGLYRPQAGVNSGSGFFKTVSEQSMTISAEQALGGGVISALSGFSLEYGANALTPLASVKLSRVEDNLQLPWNLQKISPAFSYEINPVQIFEPTKKLTVTMDYDKANKQFKQLYYFDAVKKNWLAVPSTDYPQEGKVKAVIDKSAALVAVFAKPGTLTVGKASWYKYKGGDFAASPDFPKGSQLRVTNLDNGKSVEIVVNDWGPERDKHPDRAIDLDKVAFAKIASTGAGIINVAVSPIKLAADANGRVLGVRAEALGVEPKIASKSVFVINESDGQTWLEKNSDAVRPIASLSKVVAMSVYLALKPDLEEIVTYKQADEQLNYLYCKPWENTKVKLKDGAQLKAKDLFNSALIGSANNAVESLVRNSGLSREAFIAKMNETVAAWGATNTKFVEPTGLSNKNVSSARDFAVIVREAMKNKTLAATSVQAAYSFTTLGKEKHTIKNTNKLIVEAAQLNLRAEQFPIIASKTGFLNEAGYCLTTRVKHGDNNYTIVTLGAPTRAASFTDMADLINYLKFKSTWI